MSTKIAIVIGDYSNGWSDAIQVQGVTKIKEQSVFANDRDFIMQILSTHLNSIIESIEKNEKINPKPKDEPCCSHFEEWSKSLSVKCSCIICPYCGTKITDERKTKYFKREE